MNSDLEMVASKGDMVRGSIEVKKGTKADRNLGPVITQKKGPDLTEIGLKNWESDMGSSTGFNRTARSNS